MFEWLVDPEAWISLLTLTALEIVLGIDNIIFISILVGRLPANQRQSGRRRQGRLHRRPDEANPVGFYRKRFDVDPHWMERFWKQPLALSKYSEALS